MNHAAPAVSGLKQFGLIASKEFGNRFRTGWVLACATVWLGAIGLTSLYGLVQVGRVGLLGYERTVVSLLNLVQYLVPLLGLLLGHDLLVAEREERTLALVLASGVSRLHLLMGKLAGAALALLFPLVLGFTIAGTVIGLATGEAGLRQFVLLAVSGVALGFVFLAIGLALSTWARNRMQALVFALLAWCVAVFAFDLVALGLVLAAKAPTTAQEIEAACDPTHLNSAVDLHGAFDSPSEPAPVPAPPAASASLDWVYCNPIDLFRAVSFSPPGSRPVSLGMALSAFVLWLGVCLGASAWRFQRLDL